MTGAAPRPRMQGVPGHRVLVLPEEFSTRRGFDAIVSWVGVVVTAVLLVAGTLMTVGYAYTNCSVHHELAAQQISFPAAGNPALASPDIGPFLNKYAGQQLVNGAQARACADHFIAVPREGGRWRPDLRPAQYQGPGEPHRREPQGPGGHPFQG
jgi:hypothetical protein